MSLIVCKGRKGVGRQFQLTSASTTTKTVKVVF